MRANYGWYALRLFSTEGSCSTATPRELLFQSLSYFRFSIWKVLRALIHHHVVACIKWIFKQHMHYRHHLVPLSNRIHFMYNFLRTDYRFCHLHFIFIRSRRANSFQGYIQRAQTRLMFPQILPLFHYFIFFMTSSSLCLYVCVYRKTFVYVEFGSIQFRSMASRRSCHDVIVQGHTFGLAFAFAFCR